MPPIKRSTYGVFQGDAGAGREPKSLLEIEGGHNDAYSVSSARYLRGVDRFLSSLWH